MNLRKSEIKEVIIDARSKFVCRDYIREVPRVKTTMWQYDKKVELSRIRVLCRAGDKY
jgi:hypothetical protein